MRLALLMLLAGAALAEPSKRMSRESAARLDRALMHLREANDEIRRLKEAAKVYEAEALEICAAHEIDPAELGDRVVVDFFNGEIRRPPRPSPSPRPRR